MTTNAIQPSFSAGELTPLMSGRVDFEKYRTGLSISRNFFVDFRGGVSTRPGTEFCGMALGQDSPPVPIPFVFNAEQTYMLEVGDGYMRVIQDGAYLLEDDFAITVGTNTSTLSLTIPGAGYAVGDIISFNTVVGFDRTNGINALEGRALYVLSAVGDVYTFGDPASHVPVNSTTWTAFVSGSAARVYTVDAPWAADVLYELVYSQSADIITVTHPDYQEYKIQRFGQIDWRIEPKTYGSSLAQPSGLVVAAVNNPGTTEQFYYIYAVTAVDTDTNEESVVSTVAVVNAALDQNTGVANQLAWDAVPGLAYNIYEAERAPQGSENSTGPWFFSFIGRALSPPWTDNNIAPDSSIVPPTNRNPFQSGEFSDVIVLNEGFGYISAAALITDSTGTGATLTVTQDSAGAITDIDVTTAGMDYTAPTIEIIETDTVDGTGLVVSWAGTWQSFGGGSIPATNSITITTPGTHYHVPYVTFEVVGAPGAYADGFGYIECVNGVPTTLRILAQPFVGGSTAGVTLTITPVDTLPGERFPTSLATARAQLSGQTNPALNTYALQRHMLAATRNQPATFWTTRPGLYGNLDTSFPSQPNDALTGTIVGPEVNNIRSLTPMTYGIVALTARGAYQISGGSPGAALSPTNITAQAQAFSGASTLQPLRVGYNLIYETPRGYEIRDISYNFYLNIYTGDTISALSEHLFRGRHIRQWAWAEEPFHLAWAVRDDGILLNLAYVKAEKVAGWTRADTQGSFKGVAVIPESGQDAPYFVVRRRAANGAYYYFMERLAGRFFGENYGLNIAPDPEVPWCVDCGVAYLPQNGPDDVVLTLEFIETPGQIGTPTIVLGGSGYTDASFVQILDRAVPGGTGATATLVTTAGEITGVTITDAGRDYQDPYVVLGDGEGAVISLPVLNRAFFSVSSPYLDDTYLGWILRTAGGVGRVVDVVSSQLLEVDIVRPFTGFIPDSPEQQIEPKEEGEWTLTPEVSVVGGLDHLEGLVVAVVADGSVLASQTVVDGCITLDNPASYIIIGLGFTAQARTMRLDLGNLVNTVQGKRKSIDAVTVRVADTTGLSVGPSFDDLQEIKPDVQGFGLPISLGNTAAETITGPFAGDVEAPLPFYFADTRVVVDGGWTREGVICIQQNYPRPATILAVIPEYNVGDQ